MTSVRDVLESIGYTKIIDRGGELSICPLYRDSDNPYAVSVNASTGEFYDFVEKFGGSLETLVEKTLGQPMSEELKDRLSYGEVFVSKTSIDISNFTKFYK